jgi:hypothetical protein
MQLEIYSVCTVNFSFLSSYAVLIWAVLPMSSASSIEETNKQSKLRGPSPQANYTDQATAACEQI